jgi:multidrug resistance efflux pump
MKKLLILSWLIVLISLFILQSVFQGESTIMKGISEDSAQTIRFEYPVEIVHLAVMGGQKIKQGEVVLKVRRNNLAASQAVLNQQLHELESRNQSEISSIQSEIKSLQAKKTAEQAVLDIQIHKLQTQFKANHKLLTDITGSYQSVAGISRSFREQLNVLKKQRIYLGISIQAQIDNLKEQFSNQDRPIFSQINELKERRSELQRQVTELVVTTDLSGQVGNILFTPGDTVDAFQPILTIHALYPKSVKAYIHENVYSQVKKGQQVWIVPTTLGASAIAQQGVVENIGNRIIDYPQRLKKNILVPSWGREVLIKLPAKNSLLLGEKVNISLEKPQPDILKKATAYYKKWFTINAIGTAYASN